MGEFKKAWAAEAKSDEGKKLHPFIVHMKKFIADFANITKIEDAEENRKKGKEKSAVKNADAGKDVGSESKASLASGDGGDVKLPVFEGIVDAGLDMLFSGQQAEVELLKKSDDKDQKMGNW